MTVEHEGHSWLGTARAVLALTFPLDAESCLLAQGRRYAEHANVMSHQAYEPQVAVPRLLELLRRLAVKATFYVPGITAERWPNCVEAVLADGHEIAHHSYSHRMPVSMSPDEERRDFERALEALAKFGVQPKGHRAAAWGARWSTPALVAEYGLLYESNLMDDDRPYLLETGAGEIVELPPHWIADDFSQYAYMVDPPIGHTVDSPLKATELWRLELEAMRDFGCLMQLTCHPFLSGRPSRLKALAGFIEHTLSLGDVSILTCEQIARRAVGDRGLTRRRIRPVVVDPETYPDL